jgi:hypothetical protein
MSHPRTRICCLISGVLAGFMVGWVVQSRPLSATAPTGTVLAGVAALDAPITVTETKISLREVLGVITGMTGVPLAAAREVADEPVAVVVKTLPARELLEALAELLEFQWRRSEDGFEIRQDASARRREESLRQAAQAAAEQALLAEVQRLVEAAGLRPEEARALQQRDEEERSLLSSEQREALLRSPEEQKRRARLTAIRRCQEPIPRALARLMGRLPPEQWSRLLRDERPVTFSTHPSIGELPLPAETLRAFRATQRTLFSPDLPLCPDDPEIERDQRLRERALQEEWASAVGYRVTLRPTGGHRQTDRTLAVTIAAEPFRPDGRAPLAPGDDPTASLSVVARPVVSAPGSTLQAPSSRGEPGADTDPVFSRTAPVSFDLPPRRSPWGIPGRSSVRFPELLPTLAECYGVQFVADAYWSAPRITGNARGKWGAPKLGALLEQLAGTNYRWARRGRLIQLRSKTWFLDRPRELPLRWVRRWSELCERYGALPLAEWTQRIAALPDVQLATLAQLSREVGLPPEIESVYSARHGLRLYASLAPAQQEALWRGEAIPVSRLSSSQRAQFALVVERGADVRLTAGSGKAANGSTVDRQRSRTAPGEGANALTGPNGERLSLQVAPLERQRLALGAWHLVKAGDHRSPTPPGPQRPVPSAAFKVADVMLRFEVESRWAEGISFLIAWPHAAPPEQTRRNDLPTKGISHADARPAGRGLPR